MIKKEIIAILEKNPQTYKELRKTLKGANTDKHIAFKELQVSKVIEKVEKKWRLKT